MLKFDLKEHDKKLFYVQIFFFFLWKHFNYSNFQKHI